MAKVVIRQIRSAIRTNPHQRGTLEALGLNRPGSKVEREDTPQLRGQVRVVSHLVEVEEG